MIMDPFGNGEAVQQSVIEGNADWHMEKVVEQFQRVNDWERTKLIMTGEFFAKLKADLDSSMNMKKCLDSVIRYQRRKEDEYVTRAIMPCTQRNIIYGEEMNQFLGMTSEWLADVFLSEYTYAVNPEAIKR
ncbi:hypothetical protein C6341_g2967 [Phytophthora cactorum]|nr:hypothetical protein C6341_g2967 [Phytophthora cactorum]